MADYSADQIDWLRPPEVEGEHGEWTSRWLLRVRQAPSPNTGPPEGIHLDVLATELVDLGGSEVRVELRTRVHPLDPEGYLGVDAVFHWIDSHLGVVEINGSDRSKWRTFR